MVHLPRMSVLPTAGSAPGGGESAATLLQQYLDSPNTPLILILGASMEGARVMRMVQNILSEAAVARDALAVVIPDASVVPAVLRRAWGTDSAMVVTLTRQRFVAARLDSVAAGSAMALLGAVARAENGEAAEE